jgi:hypothetical protein
LFVPGLVDPAAIAELAKGPLPVAVMVWPGAPPVAELAADYRRLRRGAREDRPAPLMGQWVNLGVDVRERTLENRVRSGQSISSKSMSRAR